MTIEIRQADFNDPVHRAGVVDVIDSYARDPVGGGEPLSADVRQRLPPALADHPTALVLLAFDAGRPVGVAVCFFGLSTFLARPLLNVHDLAIVPEYRGKGVGYALLEAAEAAARQRGCCKLTLEVQETNQRARALYARFGFNDFVVGGDGPASLTRFLSKPLPPRAATPSDADELESSGTKS
jgi:GNAT superfamily N-acetyltransferase